MSEQHKISEYIEKMSFKKKLGMGFSPDEVYEAICELTSMYNDVLAKELKALDLTATAFCMDNDIRAYAFELKDPMNIYRVAMGEKIGTELHR